MVDLTVVRTHEENITHAVNELKTTIVGMASKMLNEQGFRFFFSGKAPESFEELTRHWEENGRIPIRLQNSYGTIYGSAYVNGLLRFWHDCIHLMYLLDFSYEDEEENIRIMLDQAGADGCSELALEILECDMLGQAMFYKEHGRFVTDQRKFVLDCLQYGTQRVVDRPKPTY